jgi:hypothetical protein
MGYPTYNTQGDLPRLLAGDGTSARYGLDQWEGDMPEVATKSFVMLAAAGVRSLTWYHLFDREDRAVGSREYDSENWFGLIWLEDRNDLDKWHRKGGYWAYAICANNIPGKTYKNRTFFTDSVPDDIKSYYFEGADGKRTLVVWNTHPLRDTPVTIALGGSNHKIWNTETGVSTGINATSTYTLYRSNNYQQTLIFLTWQE